MVLSQPCIGRRTAEWASFRVCYNAIDINAHSNSINHPFANQREMFDSCSGAQVLSAMDIKVGYHNVRCTPNTQNVLSITTQEGLFKWVRMPFSLQQVPACFYFIMDSLLHDL